MVAQFSDLENNFFNILLMTYQTICKWDTSPNIKFQVKSLRFSVSGHYNVLGPCQACKLTGKTGLPRLSYSGWSVINVKISIERREYVVFYYCTITCFKYLYKIYDKKLKIHIMNSSNYSFYLLLNIV